MTMLRSFVFGLIFGAGLLFSGMTDPARVIGFLDWTGAWDPSLAFVMGGAVVTALPIFLFVRHRGRPLAAQALEEPESMRIDARLVVGSALFGIGWSLAGICPGPAFVIFGLAPLPILLFLATMIAGLVLSKVFQARDPA
jgi:uncharacterized membrane protein YedE/YeeE